MFTAAKNAISQADTDIKNSQMKIKHSQEEAKKRKSELKKSSSDYDKDKSNLDNVTKQINKIKVSKSARLGILSPWSGYMINYKVSRSLVMASSQLYIVLHSHIQNTNACRYICYTKK